MRKFPYKYKICYQTRIEVWLAGRVIRHKLCALKWRKRVKNPYTIYNRHFSKALLLNVPHNCSRLYYQKFKDRQILKHFYGGLSETYFRNGFLKSKFVVSKIINFFEGRFDIVLVRLFLESTTLTARCSIMNGKYLINNKKKTFFMQNINHKDFIRCIRSPRTLHRIISLLREKLYYINYIIKMIRMIKKYLFFPSHVLLIHSLIVGGTYLSVNSINTVYFPRPLTTTYLKQLY